MSESEAKRVMEVAEDLLGVGDLQGSRRFAKRAQELDPHVEGADQIVAIIDVLLASDKRINRIYVDWYALLQLDRRDVDLDQIKRQYKRLALLLHPDKNKFLLAATAFKLVCDASSCLSDPVKRSVYDAQTSCFNNYEPIVLNNQPPPPPRPQPQPRKRKLTKAAADAAVEEVSTFWTVCPYCYYLYEYPRVYENCCLRCQNCRRGFHGAVVQSPPPPVGDVKDFYYCTWAFFPIRCVMDSDSIKNSSWTPSTSMFSAGKRKEPSDSGVEDFVDTRGGVETDESHVLRKQTSASLSGANLRMPVSGDNHVEHHKTSRPKTTARKTVVSKPIVTKRTASKSTTPKLPNQKIIDLHTKVIGENIIPEWVGMDLNLEIAETEEPIKAEPVRVGIQGIDLEATEGIEFFEGIDKEATGGIEFIEELDSLLGNSGPTDPAG